MKNYAYIKKKLLLLIVLLLVIFSVITFYTEKKHIQIEIDKQNSILNKNVQKTFNVLLEDLKDTTSKRIHAMLIYQNHIIEQKFAQKDRDALYKLVKPRFDMIKLANPYLEIMTFRLNDSSTFLRVHKPSMYGDKLNKKRTIIIDTNHLQKEYFGFEVGKLKMTYRVVIPIFYNNKHVGLIEVGIAPEYIMKRINRIYNLKNALLIKKDVRDISLDKNKMVTIQKDYYLARGDELFKKHAKEIVFNTPHNHIIQDNKIYHISSNLNLFNHKHEIIAKILFAYETTQSLKDFNKILKTDVIQFILMVFILLIILNMSFNYFINKILFEMKKTDNLNKQLDQLNKSLEIRIENEIKKNREKDYQLIKQNRLAQIGEMISMIAHQWRQPLNAISSATNLLLLKSQLNMLDQDNTSKITSEILDYTQRLSSTINNFRDFFKPDQQKQEASYSDVLNKVFSITETSIKDANINIIKELNSDIVFKTYQNDLIQVILNIIQNAKEALLQNEIENPYIKIQTYNNTLTISDNAGGISDEIIDNIFDPYFTTKTEKNGTGLGLYMSKMIIEEHCYGKLTVSNTKDGAMFKIELSKTI